MVKIKSRKVFENYDISTKEVVAKTPCYTVDEVNCAAARDRKEYPA